MCQKDLGSYRLRLLLSRPNADKIANNLNLHIPNNYIKNPFEKSSII